ncbi:MAG: VOC family protein [Syntrophothermus sp.]
MRFYFGVMALLVFLFSGCIKHSNQPLRKNNRQKAVVNAGSLKSISPKLLTDDVNRTIEFYKDKFGFEVLATVPDTGRYNLAIAGNGKVEIMFMTRERFAEEYGMFKDAQPGGTFCLSIETNDIVPLFEKSSDGAVIVKELHQTFYGTKEFSVKDNNGYILTFSENMKK